MFHLFVFSPSQYNPIGSAEPSTNALLVAWPAHNLLIPLPVLPRHVLVYTDYYIFTILLTFLSFYESVYVHYHVSLSFYLSTPVCTYRLISKVTMDHHPKGSALPSWCAKSNLSPHSFVGTHSCLFHSFPQNPHYPITSLTPIISPKQPHLKTKNSLCTTPTALTTTTSSTMSIKPSLPTIFPKKPCSKRSKQYAQITIPKRHPPAFSVHSFQWTQAQTTQTISPSICTPQD